MKIDLKRSGATGPTQPKVPEGKTTSQGAIQKQAVPLKWVAVVGPPTEYSVFYDLQDLFRTRLTGPLLRLIPQLTGLRLHVWWHRPLDFQARGAMPVLCPRARQRTVASWGLPERCETCLQRNWKPALSSADQAQPFIGLCGDTSFCVCLQVANTRPLTLVLQSRITDYAIAAPRRRARGSPLTHHALSSAAFQHAVALLRLIQHDLQFTAQVRMAGSAAKNTFHRLDKNPTDARRPTNELCHPPPDLQETTTQPGSGNHAQKLVDAMREYVHQHYYRPFGLADLASAMKMNASYVSALFSQTTGVSFHQYLEAVRLAKAKELLCDPRNRVSEAAWATGYASPDAFRHAFKAHESLSPQAWRAGQ